MKVQRNSQRSGTHLSVFFKQTPSIGSRIVMFMNLSVAKCCMGKGNSRIVCRYLDTGDAKSTSNLRKHAKWKEDAVATADNMRNVQAAPEVLGKMKPGNASITEAFKRAAKGTVTYSHHQHTITEAQWVTFINPLGPYNNSMVVRRSSIGSQKVSVPSKSSTIVVSSHWWRLVAQVTKYLLQKLSCITLKRSSCRSESVLQIC